ncbi:hypothetical protein Trco_003739 [Trichoderma cornu-damae]|uniref:Uncharacterized protein n=1 Tax=Trichoderma cornu-damae TaxID=654480 RepID=A0A9P8QLL9_9HYPO|nr:hypothetical protein Trco_003739 [Trichoderma cornu-damae]
MALPQRMTVPQVLPPNSRITGLTPQLRVLLPAADLERAYAMVITWRLLRRVTLPQVLLPNPRTRLTPRWRMLLSAADHQKATLPGSICLPPPVGTRKLLMDSAPRPLLQSPAA